MVEVGVGEGELEGFGSVGDDEGLAEIGEEGIVFAEGDGGVGDLDAATGVPLGEQLVELAVGDADHGGGFLAGAAVGDRTSGTAAVTDVGEHLQFELAGELSHAGGEVGAHQFGGIGEVAAIRCEGDAVAVADEGGGARDELDSIVVGGGAADQAREVAEFVEDCGEEVVAAIGFGAKGGAEEGFSVQRSEFRVFPWTAVDEPAEAVGVGVEGEGAGGGATGGVEAGDVGFGELAGGEIEDLDIEVKWSCPCQEFCPACKSIASKKSNIRGDYFMSMYTRLSIDELINRYAQGERNFAGVEVYADTLPSISLSEVNLCGAKLKGDWSGVNLSKAWLKGANLQATFRNADLSGSSLRGAELAEGDFTAANLSRASLRGAGLGQTLMTDANLCDADLRGAFMEEIGLERANLTGVDLEGAIGVDLDWWRSQGCVI